MDTWRWYGRFASAERLRVDITVCGPWGVDSNIHTLGHARIISAIEWIVCFIFIYLAQLHDCCFFDRINGKVYKKYFRSRHSRSQDRRRLSGLEEVWGSVHHRAVGVSNQRVPDLDRRMVERHPLRQCRNGHRGCDHTRIDLTPASMELLQSGRENTEGADGRWYHVPCVLCVARAIVRCLYNGGVSPYARVGRTGVRYSDWPHLSALSLEDTSHVAPIMPHLVRWKRTIW